MFRQFGNVLAPELRSINRIGINRSVWRVNVLRNYLIVIYDLAFFAVNKRYRIGRLALINANTLLILKRH